MVAENIRRFNVQALRVIAYLYGSHPTPVTVDNDTILKPKNHSDGGVTVELPDGTEHGTIVWLHRNGFVAGDLIESNPIQGHQSAGIMNAQLTARALQLLQRRESNVGGELGEAVAAMAFGPKESLVADLLGLRLVGG